MELGGEERRLDAYVKLFYSRCILRPACHRCPYASVRRGTDLTIGDYWGIEKVMPKFYDPMGNSLILIHSPRGRKLFEEKRERFWKDYQSKGIEDAVKKYGNAARYDGDFIQKIKIIWKRMSLRCLLLQKNVENLKVSQKNDIV